MEVKCEKKQIMYRCNDARDQKKGERKKGDQRTQNPRQRKKKVKTAGTLSESAPSPRVLRSIPLLLHLLPLPHLQIRPCAPQQLHHALQLPKRVSTLTPRRLLLMMLLDQHFLEPAEELEDERDDAGGVREDGRVSGNEETGGTLDDEEGRGEERGGNRVFRG
jgi:hypothetical protein